MKPKHMCGGGYLICKKAHQLLKKAKKSKKFLALYKKHLKECVSSIYKQ